MTNQDQEDHRLAALAAGYEFHVDRSGFSLANGLMWRPRHSRSDSFGLMSALGMTVDFADSAIHAGAFVIKGEDHFCEAFVEMDAEINTVEKLYFEAIFRCAVEIGRAKEGKANAQN